MACLGPGCHGIADTHMAATQINEQALAIWREERMGRPTVFNAEAVEAVMSAMRLGETATDACGRFGLCVGTFREWVIGDAVPGLALSYARARKAQAEAWADKLAAIADDATGDFITVEDGDGTKVKVNHENINRSRLRADTYKWLMSKLHPSVYGDKLDLTNRLEAGDSLQALLGKLRTEAVPMEASVILPALPSSESVPQ